MPGSNSLRFVGVTVSVPIADSSGAITAFAALAIILLLIGGVVSLVARGRKRQAQLEPADDPNEQTETVESEPNVGAMGLAIAAAVLAIVSVFLPALESDTFARIGKNTLIQNGLGWLIVGCAIGMIGAVYRVYSKRSTDWGVFVTGLIILGVAIYEGTGSRTKLEGVSFTGQPITDTASPAIGIYAAGAAGILAIFAGLILAGHVFDSYRGAERRTKTCPDCAETVLAAARVCKHCGHEFDVASPAET